MCKAIDQKINDERIKLFANQIHNVDVLKGLSLLPPNSVDLIITSPPYNLGKRHHTGNIRFKSYNDYDDDMPEHIYQQWQIEVLNECHRVLKTEGSMWYNHKNRIQNGVQITPYEWLLKTNFVIKQEVVWFNRSQNFDKIRFYPMTERVYWLAKSPKTKMFNAINHHDVFDAKDWKPEGTKGEFKRAFPVKMPEDILSCFPDAKVVLDPFMGSGTTAIACINTNRNYIGFELDKHYCDIANERIQKALAEKAVSE
jgi:site-specific DNA-methyltransferase (adenine-specific)